MADYDLIIRGGSVHDGLGTPARTADVAILNGRVAAIGTVTGSAREELDARGLIVTPGFVDVHTHYDGQATWSQRLQPSSNHGVTSVVMGNCGVGFAPCKPAERNLLVQVMEGVEDVPEVVMAEGLPWNWETFPDYLDALAGRQFDVDVAAQLPHSALRVYVMGARAATGEAPTADDLAAMRRLTAEAVRAGALGVSTSRNLMHRTKAGELAPSLHSDEAELQALADGLKDAGAGVFQIIPAPMGDAASEFALMRRLVERSGRPLSYSLIQMPTGDRTAWQTSLAALSDAAAAGLPMRAQVAPRPVGMFYGLDLSFHPFAYHPSYKAIKHLPLAERVAAMRTPAMRARLLAEQPEDTNPVNLKTVKSFQYSYAWATGADARADYEPELSQRLDRLAREAGQSIEAFSYDLLLADEGRAIFYQPGANYRDGNLDAVRAMLTHPQAVVGLADGSAGGGGPGRRRRALRDDLRRQLPDLVPGALGPRRGAGPAHPAAARDRRADQRAGRPGGPGRPRPAGGRRQGRHQPDRPGPADGARAHRGARPAGRRPPHAPGGRRHRRHAGGRHRHLPRRPAHRRAAGAAGARRRAARGPTPGAAHRDLRPGAGRPCQTARHVVPPLPGLRRSAAKRTGRLPDPMRSARAWLSASAPAKRWGLLLLVTLAGATALVRWDIAQRRERLYTEARTAHRLLSEATARVDAVLVTLVLTATSRGPEAMASDAAARLPAVYPQVLAAWRRDTGRAWPDEALRPRLEAAEQASRALPAPARHAVIASVDATDARYTVVLAGEPASFALRVDARRLVSTDEWPWPGGSPVRATLQLAGQTITLNAPPPGLQLPLGLTGGFETTQVLASASQPFVLQVQRRTGPAEWPWLALAAWALLCAGVDWTARRWIQERAARRRAADQVRLARASRLNALGELAAGIAHELNQPLSAVLASTQTALRIAREHRTPDGLQIDDEDAATAIAALELAGAQAQRASAVVSRLRQRLQPGHAAVAPVPVQVADVARKLVRLMSDELSAAEVQVTVVSDGSAALADPVAVEQILHNLLMNAIHALSATPARARQIRIEVAGHGDRVTCQVVDTGPGMPAAVAARLFEPFFTTRPDGLGLGLPLCQTLALAMNGQVTLARNAVAGVAMALDLPLAPAARNTP